MAKEKKAVNAITDMEVDFAQWYTDVCKKAELIDYSSIKGMFIYRPYGYAIWENIQKELDRRFKETGHENVMMPMLIPESLLQKEKDHVEGFAPECACKQRTHPGECMRLIYHCTTTIIQSVFVLHETATFPGCFPGFSGLLLQIFVVYNRKLMLCKPPEG